jgi:hypothetical protein
MFNIEIGWGEFFEVISSLVVLQGFELLILAIIMCVYVYKFIRGE